MGDEKIDLPLVSDGEREPRAKTEDEVRELFFDHVINMVGYWERDERTPSTRDKLLGLAHSIMVAIGGCAGGFPCSLDLVTSPHPDDEADARENGEDWVPSGVDLNDGNLGYRLYWRPDGTRRPGTEER